MRMMPCAPCANVHAHCTCRWGAQSTCQKLCVAGVVGVPQKETLQCNGTMKSEPNTWLVKTLQYVLSLLNSFLLSSSSLASTVD